MSHLFHIADVSAPATWDSFVPAAEVREPLRSLSPGPLTLLRGRGLDPALAAAILQRATAVGLKGFTGPDSLNCGAAWLVLPACRRELAQIQAALVSEQPAVAAELAALLARDAAREWTWAIRDRALELGPRTLVMGVVNVTPDSFSDGGRTLAPSAAVEHGLRLVAEGADLLDVGGESTRPGSAPVPAAEEIERVLPVIRALARACDVPISIDTTKAEVAVAAIDAGARIVNDVSGLRGDPDLARRIAGSGAGLVVSHLRGTPATMQVAPVYTDLFAEVLAGLASSLAAAAEGGIAPERLVVDPGVGFGKSVRHNLLLLEHAGTFRALGRPVLIGASRKSFLGAVTGRAVGDRLAGSVAAAALAIGAGAAIVRVHDVAPSLDAARLLDAARTEVE